MLRQVKIFTASFATILVAALLALTATWAIGEYIKYLFGAWDNILYMVIFISLIMFTTFLGSAITDYQDQKRTGRTRNV
jgi:glycopeptide antibiotics resistance protein